MVKIGVLTRILSFIIEFFQSLTQKRGAASEHSTPNQKSIMVIDRSYRLKEDEFLKEKFPKDLIVLHHTVGGSATSTMKWWNMDPRDVATAYVVARDGKVHEVFDPKYWAWHLGIKSSRTEKRSIGIEIASEGALTPRSENGKLALYAFAGQAAEKRLGTAADLLRTHKVVHLSETFRGWEWFDVYDEPQIDSCIELCNYLCDLFDIPHRFPLEAQLDIPDLRKWFDFKGILHHAMIRKDKSDLHPLFPYAKFGRGIGDLAWE